MMRNQIDISLADTVLIDAKNKNGVMYRLSDSGVHRYKVRILLEGQDLPFVKKVTYGLHKTFRRRHREVERTLSNPNCQLEIWTWGIFEVTADVEDNSGQVYRLTHQLNYGKQLENQAPNRFRKVP